MKILSIAIPTHAGFHPHEEEVRNPPSLTEEAYRKPANKATSRSKAYG